ncbi:Cytochrome c-551 [Burkholderiales bacterium]|nr:MAG: c-type cytochrome [Burkholderiales bacterium]CAG0989111.1 Cytochrome c-551 [Burkholderiales bacterium]
MKLSLVALVAGALVAGGAAAATPQELLTKSGCMACHQVDKKVVGPSYKDVAKKYKGDAGAAAKLADKVKKGGSGVWGQVPMPPNAAVKDDDVKAMIQHILTL